MTVVRYVALAALVVWLGALQGAVVDAASPHLGGIQVACGIVVILALLTVKFLGPPPRAFSIRLPLAVLMLVLATIDWRYGTSRLRTIANTALGFGLLVWYARE